MSCKLFSWQNAANLATWLTAGVCPDSPSPLWGPPQLRQKSHLILVLHAWVLYVTLLPKRKSCSLEKAPSLTPGACAASRVNVGEWFLWVCIFFHFEWLTLIYSELVSVFDILSSVSEYWSEFLFAGNYVFHFSFSCHSSIIWLCLN